LSLGAVCLFCSRQTTRLTDSLRSVRRPEAVHRAEDLQPDLILLDIGLPGLDGIKAARRIHDLSPSSKILFLSEESSPDVAEAALEAGGAGYLIKSDAGRELLAAVKALIKGERYISARLVGRVFFDAPEYSSQGHSLHKLQIYSSDEEFLDGYTSFVVGGLNSGNASCGLSYGGPSAGAVSETADSRLRPRRGYQEW